MFLSVQSISAGQGAIGGPSIYLFAGAAAAAVLALGALLRRLAPGFVSEERKVGNYSADVSGRRRLPLVGGPALLIGIAATALAAGSETALLCLLAAAAFFVSGFADDLLKIRRGRGLGERASLITAVGSAAWASGWLLAIERSTGAFALANWVDNSVLLAGWYFALILAIVLGAGFSDGIDGLAAGLGLLGLAALAVVTAERFAAATVLFVGGAAGFLALNLPGRPDRRRALVYLGDSGALLMGALLAAAAIISGFDLLLPILAAVWILEGASSLVQAKLLVPLYRRFRFLGGRDHRTRPYQQFRLPFIATPLHHHLDVCGLGRLRTVLVLWALQIAFAGLAVASVAAMPAWIGALLAVAGAGLTWILIASLRPARIICEEIGGCRQLVLRHGRWRWLSIERARMPDPGDPASARDADRDRWLDPLAATQMWAQLRARGQH